MRIEIVQDDPNHLRFGVRLVYQPLHFVRKVPRGAVLGHLHVPPARLRFDKEQEIPRAIALVFIIIAPWLTRLGGQRAPGLFESIACSFHQS